MWDGTSQNERPRRNYTNILLFLNRRTLPLYLLSKRDYLQACFLQRHWNVESKGIHNLNYFVKATFCQALQTYLSTIVNGKVVLCMLERNKNLFVDEMWQTRVEWNLALPWFEIKFGERTAARLIFNWVFHTGLMNVIVFIANNVKCNGIHRPQSAGKIFVRERVSACMQHMTLYEHLHITWSVHARPVTCVRPRAFCDTCAEAHMNVPTMANSDHGIARSVTMWLWANENTLCHTVMCIV